MTIKVLKDNGFTRDLANHNCSQCEVYTGQGLTAEVGNSLSMYFDNTEYIGITNISDTREGKLLLAILWEIYPKEIPIWVSSNMNIVAQLENGNQNTVLRGYRVEDYDSRGKFCVIITPL